MTQIEAITITTDNVIMNFVVAKMKSAMLAAPKSTAHAKINRLR